MDVKKVGAFISTLRKEKGITQKELADQLHVSDRTISKWERGAGLPDPSLMMDLSDFLGITVNELLSGEKNAQKAELPSAEAAVKDAVAAVYQYMRAQNKKLFTRFLAAVLLTVLVIGSAGFALKKAGENRILFPPEITCEVLQKDFDIQVGLLVDRQGTGLYDYGCAYTMDRYANVNLTQRSVWQSYTDAVPAELYKTLTSLCPGEITGIDRTESGYLVRSRKGSAVVITETDAAPAPIFQYELDTGKSDVSLLTCFISEDVLYLVTYNSDAQRNEILSVNKNTRQEQVSGFVYRDFVPDAGDEDSMGGFLFDRNNMWVKNDVLYFAETYYRKDTASVLGAYDLKENKPLFFQTIQNSHVVMVRKEPEKGQVSILINPMDYTPLKLCTIDDTTMEITSVISLKLPYEYLTRQNSNHGATKFFLFKGDMDDHRVALLLGDIVSREALENTEGSCILAVYDRTSGELGWRGRLKLSKEYEISSVTLQPAD